MEPRRAFDRDFFMGHLQEVVREYREHRHLDVTEIVAFVTLPFGQITATGFRVAPDWVLIFDEADSMHFVPLDQIHGVSIGRRPTPEPDAPKRSIGFSITEAEGT